ncbi:MAG: hypothetical protein P8181_01865 [bacterium]
MKLIGLMSLDDAKEDLHTLFEKHGVQIFSEMEIKGHTLTTIQKYGWWPTGRSTPAYSTLCFAVIPRLRADEIMDEIEALAAKDQSAHPIRAFQVDVERMV